MKRHIDETDIFKPVSPSLKDDNDWPILPLANADVTQDNGGDVMSLLLADEDNQLAVTGRVESLDSEERQFLIYNNAIPTNISIQKVQRFSYGQFDSGEIAFWAAGKSGWFEIKPSRRYRAVYKDMVEAINILYFISDLFRDLNRKQMRQTSPDTVFQKYADDATYKCEDRKHARSLFLKHRDSLLRLMSQGKEGIGWKTTAIFRFLQSDPQPSDTEDHTTPKSQAEEISSDDNPAAYLARKGKSALRPVMAKASNKGTSHQQAAVDPDETEDEDVVMAESHASPSRRKSEDELSSRPQKRRRGRPRKSSETFQSTRQPVYTAPDNREPGEVPLPLHSHKRLSQKAPTRKITTEHVDIIQTPLPSFEANQPGDVWACTFDGCAHRIFAASTDESKSLIEEHHKHHAQDSQAQMDLVCKEERPYLPVGNLIKKIRDMAAQQKAPPVSDPRDPPWKQELMRLPKPIKQKY